MGDAFTNRAAATRCRRIQPRPLKCRDDVAGCVTASERLLWDLLKPGGALKPETKHVPTLKPAYELAQVVKIVFSEVGVDVVLYAGEG
jgi:hypothetical protein